MMRRGGRPGLMGTMARTAVIAGTATAVSGGVSRRQQARAQSAADQQAVQQQPQQPQYAPPPQEYAQAPQPAVAADDSLSAQIERLATLKTAGVITDAEFSAAKAKLLGI
ncbi:MULTISPECIES: SHOCT domain-containing protein [Cryobacterium]|uniref:SHOCT domain-containing protein n=1 Tax=Cryobacterium glucosi TaxID=1259175 RepID=A0ABY2IPU6_9MICO|nr:MULTISPECIES: SHOCT domain-containing protein [Cryobacterium]MDY7527327.1 SHOCT domain-containing protein [Cryobacterium sp. 10C2]MDY7556889.1 SHOCT domain-containing protein [Cryobacterium sp. 10C3]MEB0003354.1 SHOCT domain-containing protein [Cryobacterium sp. RTC2.1]MEB0202733.1 SHOCT domain-containing protein [Cryobacterium sp. 5I3]MEB0285803.1 SHOCT domain-containing protein [Cryobacterium sp. 10S3]